MERKTPLYEVHVSEGGKIVPFAGYLLPVQYPTGILAEHEAVRTQAGLFDVSELTAYRKPYLATSTDGVGTKVAIASANCGTCSEIFTMARLPATNASTNGPMIKNSG